MRKNLQHYKNPIARLVLLNAFVYMCPAVYSTFLSAYYSTQGLTGSEIGLIFGISPIMSIAVQPLWARLADRSGNRRRVLIAVCLGAAAALLCFYCAHSFIGFFLCALLLAAFITSLVPLSDSLILTEIKQRGNLFSYIRLGGTIGYALVVLVMGRVLSSNSGIMFSVASAMFLALSLFLWRLPPEIGASQPMAANKSNLLGIKRFMTSQFFLILLFGLCGYVGLSFTMAYQGPYFLQCGYDQTMIGIASAISACSEIPTLLLVNKVYRRFTCEKLLLFSCVMMGLRLLLTGSGILWMMLSAQLLQGVTYMLLYYCCVSFVSEHLPPEYQSSGQGLLVLVQSGIGSLLGFITGGALVDCLGIQSSYYLYAGIILVISLLLMIVRRFIALRSVAV